ncbi:hypothetical protein [Lutibacter maritimus]|nr:hypothetical protein [Lutibacter maritimus]
MNQITKTFSLILFITILSCKDTNSSNKGNNKIKNENILIKNGVWKSTGGNLFWINIVQNKVFWLGMNNKTSEYELGENWCHVGNGTIIDNRIILDWSDISVGKGNLNGKIVIEIISAIEMKVIEDSGNFGMSIWNWEKDQLNFSQITK